MSLSWRLWINCWKLCIFCQVSMEETIMHFLVVLNEWRCCHRPPPGLPIKRDLQNSVGSCSLCSAKCHLKNSPSTFTPSSNFLLSNEVVGLLYLRTPCARSNWNPKVARFYPYLYFMNRIYMYDRRNKGHQGSSNKDLRVHRSPLHLCSGEIVSK